MTLLVDRLEAAVTVLAGDGHIKQRLVRAFQDNLAEIDDDELPIFLQEPFTELRMKLKSVKPLNGEGAVRASVRKMSGTEAGECGKLIVALYTQALRDGAGSGLKRPLSAEDAHELPPFLVKSVS